MKLKHMLIAGGPPMTGFVAMWLTTPELLTWWVCLGIGAAVGGVAAWLHVMDPS